MSQPTVLIADDDAALVQVLSIRCKKLGLDVFRSPDAMHALLAAHRLNPELLVLDIKMPGGNGWGICEMLAADKTFANTPVIIMTGESGEAIVERCKSLGAHYVQKGPQLWDDLQERICQVLKLTPSMVVDVPKKADSKAKLSILDQSPSSRPTLLCIDDDPDITQVIKIRLEQRYEVNVIRAFSGMQGFWTAVDNQPQAIICDMNMPDGEGNYVNGRLKSHPVTKDIPVIILTGQANASLKRQMLSLGVSAYLQKPLNFNELLETLKRYIPITEKAVQETA